MTDHRVPARRMPISSAFGLAAASLIWISRRLVPLTTAFAIPELARVSYFFADAWLAAKAGRAVFFPELLSRVVDLALDAIVIVAVISFALSSVKPSLLPSRPPFSAILLTTALYAGLWLVLDLIADRSTLLSYYYFSHHDAGDFDVRRMYLLIGVYCFVAHAALISFFYPLLGPIAARSRLAVDTLLRWHRYSYVSIFAVTALLMAAVLAARDLYLMLVQDAFPDLFQPAPIQFSDFDAGMMILYQLSLVPIDFILTTVPAVAIALLCKGLGMEQTPGQGITAPGAA